MMAASHRGRPFISSSHNRQGPTRGAPLKNLIILLALIASIIHLRHGNEPSDERYLMVQGRRRAVSFVAPTDEPSHVQLCREVLLHTSDLFGKEPASSPLFLIKERDDICLDSKNPHEALLHIFATQLLGKHAEHLELAVGYDHACGRLESSSEAQSVQLRLPSPLLMGSPQAFQKGISEEDLTGVCKRCITAYEEHQTSQAHDCLFGDILTFEDVVPLIGPNLRTFAQGRQRTDKPFIAKKQNLDEFDVKKVAEATSDDEGDQEQAPKLKGSAGNRKLFSPFIEIPELPFQKLTHQLYNRALLSNPDSDAPGHDGLERVAVYLSSEGNRLYGLPLYELASIIPRSATNIDIVASKSSCNNACLAYAKLLENQLNQLHPRSRVEQHLTNSTATIFTMAMEADVLVCPPNQQCVLPSLARTQHSSILVQHDAYKSLLKDAPNKLQVWSAQRAAILEAETNDALAAASISYVISPPPTTEQCPELRGRLGHWRQDWEVAPKLQYTTPLDHYFGFADVRFKPSEEQPFREPTTYVWEEEPSSSSCDMELFDKDRFCQLMQKMKMDRIFYLGDFVQMNMAYSLWKILGHKDSPKNMTETEPNWSRTVHCGQHTIDLVFARNERMEQNHNDVSVPRRIRNCDGAYCYPWTRKYRNYAQDKRTLLIASFGSHFYAEPDFANAFERFLNTIYSLSRPNDVVVYRTTAPGHDGCRKKGVHPFSTYENYQPTITWKYSWDLMDGFNDIAARLVAQYNDFVQQDHMMASQIHLLDIYPMTVLRPDGHVGGKDCKKCTVSNDCFYYSLPGPSDWWNHLLLNNLKDAADIKQ